MAKRARIVKKASAGAPRTTTRRDAAAQFNRKKHQQHMRQLRRRGLIIAAAVVAVTTTIGGWWMHHNGTLERTVAQISDGVWNITGNAGFAVKQVYLTGRTHADPAVVKAALNVRPGAPILQLSLSDLQQRLQAIPEVKSVVISRQLPDALSIELTERTPTALWQRNGQHLLVDNDGVVLSSGHYPNMGPLPVIVGQDAPKHVRELTALLDSSPGLQQEVVAAVRVGDRRWNVQLKRDITVMLPEENPAAAWQRFAALVQKESLLNKAIRSVDMRIEDRVFIMPSSQQKTMVTLTNARDT